MNKKSNNENLEKENEQRSYLLKLIEMQTPLPHREKAISFGRIADELRLSPITIDRMFTFASKDKDTYNIQNIPKLEFGGVDYGVKGISVTGKSYNKLSVFFINQENQREYLGWDTAKKFIQSIKSADLIKFPKIEELGDEVKEKDYEEAIKQKDFATNLEDILNDKENIKKIQSINEKRQVKAIKGLEDALLDVKTFMYNEFRELLLTKEFFNKTANHYLDALLPKKGLINRVENQENLPENIQKAVFMIKNYKRFMSPKQYAEDISLLRSWDALTTPLDAEGHLKGYLSDLKELAQKNKITGKPKDIVMVMQKLYEEKQIMTISEILPFLMLYDVKQERQNVYEQELQKSKEYKQDFIRGIELLENYFIQGSSWVGGRDESIPVRISYKLKTKTKSRGDEKLKNAQKWFRSKYVNEEFIHTKSFIELREEINSLIVLWRRQNTKPSNTQEPIETFQDEYKINLKEIMERANDVLKNSSKLYANYETQKQNIEELAQNNLWDINHFESEELQQTIKTLNEDYMPLSNEFKEAINTFHDIFRKSKATKHDIKSCYVPHGTKYVHKNVCEIIPIIQQHAQEINEKYVELETQTIKQIQENKNILYSEFNRFYEAPIETQFKIKLEGSTYKEKEDFKKTFTGIYWRHREWIGQKNKLEIGQMLEKAKQYNKTHEGKIKINILH